MKNTDTPKIVIDKDVLVKNIARMQNAVSENNCTLRPHIKTHKMVEIAKLQVDAGAVGVTVAKVSEAAVMAKGGINDIFIAYPVLGEAKTKEILKLNKNVRLIVGSENHTSLAALNTAAKSDNQTIEIRIEIDTGMGRSGVPYEKAVEFFEETRKYSNLNITGIFTFKSLIYNGESTDDAKLAGHEEGSMMVELAEKLKANGHDIKEISVGSTPTAVYASHIDGVTEVRPGTYVFNDQMLTNMGVCKSQDCAAAIVTKVVSKHYNGKLIVDGGSKTFPTDVAQNTFPHFLKGYGKVVGHDDMVLAKLSEEHGTILIDNDDETLGIGDLLYIIPNHVCTAINLQNTVLFKENDMYREVKVDARGCVN